MSYPGQDPTSDPDYGAPRPERSYGAQRARSDGIAVLPALAMLTFGLVAGYIYGDSRATSKYQSSETSAEAAGGSGSRGGSGEPSIYCPPCEDSNVDRLRTRVALLEEANRDLKDKLLDAKILSENCGGSYSERRREADRRKRQSEHEETVRSRPITAAVPQTIVHEHTIEVIGQVRSQMAKEVSGYVEVVVRVEGRYLSDEVFVVVPPRSSARYSIELENPYGSWVTATATAEWVG